MLAGKKLTDFTNLFSPHDFKKNNDIILDFFSKMNECNTIEAIGKTNLTSQTKFQLDEISKKIILSKRLIIENHAVKN